MPYPQEVFLREIPAFFERARTKVAAMVTVGSLMLSGCVSYSENSHAPDAPITAPATTLDTQRCPSPTENELSASATLLDQATIISQRQLDEINNAAKNRSTGSGDVVERMIQERKAAAEKFGLTIYDYRMEFTDLYNDFYRSDGAQLLPYGSYFNKAKDFLSRYGISLELGKPGQKYLEDGIAPDPTALESRNAKATLLSLVDSVGELPVELIQYVGLKRVIVLDIRSGKAGGFVTPFDERDVFYIDSLHAPYNTFDHELFHLIDAKQCGPLGSFVDEGFNALNPIPDFYKNHGQYISDSAYLDLFSSLFRELQLAQFAHDEAKAMQLQAQLDAMAGLVATESDYGLTALVEDKAEVGKALLSPFIHTELLDERKSILRKKAILLAARIYHDKPELLEYITEISN